jgi:predicted Fe-S protein YdhL (DUF1289 family)
VALNKRTPCLGICSTTYGDLVCRGCKRFAHEIVQWNGYADVQQEQIWRRLHRLRDEVVAQHLQIIDGDTYLRITQAAKLDTLEPIERIYELARFLVLEAQPLHKAGIAAVSGEEDALLVLQAIDREIYIRSKAHYERNFKVPV